MKPRYSIAAIAGAVAVIAGMSAAWAAAGAGKSVASLLAAENTRVQSEAIYDADALSQEVGDELVLVHGDGVVTNKAQYLQRMRSEEHTVTGMALSDQTGSVYGEVGITSGILAIHLNDHMERESRYLAVYRYSKDRWLLVRWQSTPLNRG